MSGDQANPNTPTPGTSLQALVATAMDIEARIMAKAADAGGEIDQELEAFLGGIMTDVGNKVDTYKFVIDRLEMGAEMLNTRAMEFSRAADALEGTVESMRGRIKEAMLALKLREVNGQSWRYKLSPSKPRLVLDQGFSNPDYLITETVTKIDSVKLRKDLEAGKAVLGASFEDTFSLRPYINKAAR